MTLPVILEYYGAHRVHKSEKYRSLLEPRLEKKNVMTKKSYKWRYVFRDADGIRIRCQKSVDGRF